MCLQNRRKNRNFKCYSTVFKMITKSPPEIVATPKKSFMSTLNEYQKRRYPVTKNMGYMTTGTSHDTSGFVCDNIKRVWEEHLKEQYLRAKTIVILCDGGGSNSNSHRIVKQNLMCHASELDMNLPVMHYPPYCSKYNPIEYRLFP